MRIQLDGINGGLERRNDKVIEQKTLQSQLQENNTKIEGGKGFRGLQRVSDAEIVRNGKTLGTQTLHTLQPDKTKMGAKEERFCDSRSLRIWRIVVTYLLI